MICWQNIIFLSFTYIRKEIRPPSDDYEVITRATTSVPAVASAPMVFTYEIPDERAVSAHETDHQGETLTANRLYSTIERDNTEQLQRNPAYESVL